MKTENLNENLKNLKYNYVCCTKVLKITKY